MHKHLTKELKEIEKEIRTIINEGHTPFYHHINFTQIQIIHYLLENQNTETCQKDFEAFLGLNKASISGSLDALEEKGLIKRTQSTEDGRKNIITLSQSYLDQQNSIQESLRELDRQLLDGISEEEIDNFFLTLDKIHDNLKKLRNEENSKVFKTL